MGAIVGVACLAAGSLLIGAAKVGGVPWTPGIMLISYGVVRIDRWLTQ